MHPILFRIGGFAPHTYGIAMAAGFLLSVLLLVRAGRRQGVSGERLLDLSFWILLGALLGSRLLYLVTEAGPYYHLCVGSAAPAPRGPMQILLDCSRPLWLWEGGLVFYGGLIGGVLVSIGYCLRRGLAFLRIADLAIPLVALGHAFGRLGCYAAGCCYGKPTSSWVGARFPSGSVAYQEMVQGGLLPLSSTSTPPLHPTQLYEVLAELVIFFVVLLINRRKRYHGQGLLAYLALYPAARLVLELFRADPDRHFLLALQTPGLNRVLGLSPELPSLLSTSQAVSLLLLTAALLVWRGLRKKEGRDLVSAAGS